MKRLYIYIMCLCACAGASAQATLDEIRLNPEKSGGIYYAYPATEAQNTPAPAGYEPFYISHYGRHGSRYLISDRDYRTVIDLLEMADTANALTPAGADLLRRLGPVWEEARGRGGELTPLGARQHHGIAQRMYDAYPQVFADSARITARSTVVMRCAHSMFAFVEGLKEKNPRLAIPRESSERWMSYLNYHSPESNHYTRHRGTWYEENRKFQAAMTRPDRLVASIFSDDDFVLRNVNPEEFMWGLYWVAVDMQNMETADNFLDLFTAEELYDLWQAFNYSFYVTNANHPASHGLLISNAYPLLTNIIESAEEHIAGHTCGADLRFGHDGNLIPLAAALHLQGADAAEADPYKLASKYAGFKVSPMAGNVQVVFFRNADGDVLVKFLLNESEIAIPLDTDIFPYYRWSEVKDFYQRQLSEK